MGIAYGSGAVKCRRVALFISAVGVFAGAAIGGGEVIKTIGSDLIPASIVSVKVAMTILIGGSMTLFVSNLLGVPLSTSQVTVGSVIGVGIAYQSIYVDHLVQILVWWVVTPVIAFACAFLFGRAISWFENRNPSVQYGKRRQLFVLFVVMAGFFEAFSAGMNNVANATGPLVGAGLISISEGMVLGGLFIALGAFLFGGRVIETNGKKITDLSLLQGMTVSATSASLVIVASLFGIPVPITQVTTTGILGIGASSSGIRILKKHVIQRMITLWIVSPVLSLAISFGLVKLVLDHSVHTTLIILGVFLVTVGFIALFHRRSKKEELTDV